MTQSSLFTQLWNEWLRETRRQRMNIGEAARLMGFSEFTLCEVELGRRLFSQEELDQFLQIMNVVVPDELEIPIESDAQILRRRQRTMVGLQRHFQSLGVAKGGDTTEVELQAKLRATTEAATAAITKSMTEATTKVRRFLELKKTLARVEMMRAEMVAIGQDLKAHEQKFPGFLPAEIIDDLD